ncbi:MAG: CDP-diacylglycerol--serine O-phosphatidyltransferase [Pseudomonadota bacterium]
MEKEDQAPLAELATPARRGGIYLLPNLLTTGALFSGFYAIIAAMNSDFEVAAAAIFIAMVLDSLDGRVARMTNTQSEFGGQYDSLSDLTCFGLAPALVMYHWGLVQLGKPGWLAAFFYTAATALRLARFNTSPLSTDKHYFYGLPCPAAAGFVAGFVWVTVSNQWHQLYLVKSGLILTCLMGALMVSNVPYHSFKDLGLKGRVPFVVLLATVFLFVVVSLDPPQVLFGIFALYVLSAPCKALFGSKPPKSIKLPSED